MEIRMISPCFDWFGLIGSEYTSTVDFRDVSISSMYCKYFLIKLLYYKI